MTTIVADQLITLLEQPIVIDREIKLAGIKSLLYFHDLPDGTFRFNFYNENEELIKSYPFTSLTAANAINTVNRYFWLDYALQGNLHLIPGAYTIRLEATSYTFGPAWVGLAKDYGNVYGNVLGDTVDFSSNPYSIKLIEYQDREGIK